MLKGCLNRKIIEYYGENGPGANKKSKLYDFVKSINEISDGIVNESVDISVPILDEKIEMINNSIDRVNNTPESSHISDRVAYNVLLLDYNIENQVLMTARRGLQVSKYLIPRLLYKPCKHKVLVKNNCSVY